jgi:Ca2+-binding RTX toxin-like protein
VTVRPDPDIAYSEPRSPEPRSDEVHVSAAPGESNDVAVAYAGDGQTVTVTDAGAPLVAQESCTQLDAHSARCVARPLPQSRLLLHARVLLGDLDEHLTTTRPPRAAGSGAVTVDAGPGNDRIDAGNGPVDVNGGGGRDEVIGSAYDDSFADGDHDDSPDADRFLAGGGVDTVSYATRQQGVTVDLNPGGTKGAPGEGDIILDARAGSDVLRGGAASDYLGGDAGSDVLHGGPGSDELDGGSAVDTLFCGGGGDLVSGTQAGEILTRACETLEFDRGADSVDFTPVPRVRGARAIFSLYCPVIGEAEESLPCGGRSCCARRWGVTAS